MSASQDPIVIVGAARTPMGGFQGDFSSLAAHDLGGAAIKAAMQLLGRDSGELRLPMTPLDAASIAKLRRSLVQYGLLPAA